MDARATLHSVPFACRPLPWPLAGAVGRWSCNALLAAAAALLSVAVPMPLSPFVFFLGMTPLLTVGRERGEGGQRGGEGMGVPPPELKGAATRMGAKLLRVVCVLFVCVCVCVSVCMCMLCVCGGVCLCLSVCLSVCALCLCLAGAVWQVQSGLRYCMPRW